MDSEKFEPIKEQNEKSGKVAKWMVGIIIAILVIIVLAIGVMAKNNSAEAIFEKQIDKLLAYEEAAQYDTIKMNVDLETDVQGTEDNFFDDTKVSFNMERDNDTQEELYGIKLTKADNELINAEAKIETETENAYINLGDLFDKTIEIDVSELLEDGAGEVSESLNFMQLLSAKKVETILKKEIKEQLKSEYFSSEKTTIDDKTVTKNILKMSGKELKDFVRNVCTNLMENDEFIDCFEDGEDVKSTLREIILEVEESEISDDTYFEMDLYTTGLLAKVQRVDFAVTEDGATILVELTKVNDEEYTYKLLGNGEQILEGTLKVQMSDNDAQIELTAQVEETIVTVKASTKVVYNEELTDFDMSNVVESQQLTVEDIMTLYNNFLESELYDVIEEVSDAVYSR